MHTKVKCVLRSSLLSHIRTRRRGYKNAIKENGGQKSEVGKWSIRWELVPFRNVVNRLWRDVTAIHGEEVRRFVSSSGRSSWFCPTRPNERESPGFMDNFRRASMGTPFRRQPFFTPYILKPRPMYKLYKYYTYSRTHFLYTYYAHTHKYIYSSL